MVPAAPGTLGVVVEKSKSSLLSSSIFCVRQMVLRVGFKFKLTMARVRTPAPSRLLLALLAGAGVQAAMALPQDGKVTSGNITIGAPANGSLNITQTTSKGVIDWQSFNVASGEKVNFLQPSATSSTLNRVIGSDPTSIFGQINANGQVFLVNNSGIYFAPGAQVNAAGLVASTLSLADADYLAGNYVLSGTGGRVDNQGVLKAGFVALAGAQVSNTGTIVADGGTAALAAGSRITMNLTGSDLVSVSVDAPTAAALVHSGGIVQADGGQVLISAKATDALLGTVVNVDGIVQAHSIGSHNGVITLDGGSSGVVRVSGTLDASGKAAGETGGTVKVTGADVGLFNGTIDVSGDAGGGVVRVGGDWHGAGADGDANASQAIVDDTSVINANAITSGNGGNVVVWSNDHTQVAGTIVARGGSTGGDGGAAETSAHEVLEATGTVDLGASAGKGGTWLIDPHNIQIKSLASGTPSSGISTSNPFLSSGDSAILKLTTLNGALTSGTNVDVTTGDTGTVETGNILVSGAIASTGLTGTQTVTLNLNAMGNISFDAAGSIVAPGVSTASFNVNLNAGTVGAGSASPGTNPSTITMDSASSIGTGAGSFTATAKGDITLSTLHVGGTATISSGGGNITQASTSVPLTVAGLLTIDAGSGGNVTLTNATNVIPSLTVSTGTGNAGAVDVHTTGDMLLGAISADTLHVQAHGNVTQNGVIATGTSTSIDDTLNNGTIQLDTQANDFTKFMATTSGTTAFVHVTNPNDLALGTITTHDLTIGTNAVQTGVVTQGSGDVAVVGTLSVISGATKNITVGSSASNIGTFTAAGGDISVTSGTNLLLGDITAGDHTTTGILTTSTSGSVGQAAGSTIQALSTSFGAGAGGVDIENTTNVIGHWGASSGGTVKYVSTGGVDLALTTAGNLNVTANGGDITQSGVVHVTSGGTTTLTDTSTDAKILLNTQVDNNLRTLTASTAGAADAISITNQHDLALGNITTSALTVDTSGGVATGVVSQATNTGILVSGAVTVTANAADNITVGSTGAAHGSSIGGNFGATGNVVTVSVGKAAGDGLVLDNIHAASLSTTTGGNGSVAQAATKTINATSTSFGAGTGGVTIGNVGNIIGTWGANAGGAVAFTSTGAVQLGNVSSPSLTVNAGGTVNQLNATKLNVSGLTDIETAGNFITLDQGNGLHTVKATGSTVTLDSTLSPASSLVLDDIVATTSLTTATGTAGSVTQATGKTIITPSATFGGGSGGVDIENTGNAITHWGASTGTTGAVVFTTTSASAFDLSGVTSGSLTVNTGGAVTQSAALDITGAASIQAGANNITLNGANSFGTFGATGGAVSVSATKLPTSGLSLDNISATSFTTATGLNGGVSQHGSGTTVNATTTNFGAGTAGVTIGNAGNTIGTWGSTDSTGTVAFHSTSPVHLGANAANVLNVIANGLIDQANTTSLAVGSTSSFDAGGTAAITLDKAANIFGGLVTASGSGSAVTVHDTGVLSVRLSTVTSGDLNATGALTVDGHTTAGLVADGNGVQLGTTGHTLTVDGTLGVDSGTGNITQGGTVFITGGANLQANTANVTLADANNTFGSPVTAHGTSVTLSAAGGLNAIASLAGGTGDLSLTATGGLTGTTTVTTTGNVTLHSGDVLNTSGVISGNNVSLTGTALGLGGDVTATGTLGLTASAGGISQGGGTTVASTSTAPVTVSATGIVDLNEPTNNFVGPVTVSGTTVSLHDTSALTAHVTSSGATLVSDGLLTVDGHSTGLLDVTGVGIVFGTATTAVDGALTAHAGSGSITQSNVVTVGTTSDLTAGGAIALNDSTHDMFGGLVTASGSSVDIEGKTSLDVTPTIGAGGSLVLVATGNTSTLTLNGVGNINTTGDVTLSAGAGLTVPGSITARNVTLGGGAISIQNAITATGTFGATSTASITESGAGAISAAANPVTIGAAGNVTLNGANDFSTLTVSGAAVSVHDANALTAHVSSTSGASLTAGAANQLVVDGGVSGGDLVLNAGSIVFGSSPTSTTGVTGGNLSATASAGTITQADTLTVTGTSHLDAGTSNILLNAPANNFGTLVTVANGGAVTLQDGNALAVHLGTVSSADLTAGAGLTVDGGTTGNLAAHGSGVSFGATTVGGTLIATGGNVGIAQTGKLAVGSTSNFSSTGGTIVLGDATNDFQSVTANGPSVTLTNGGTFTAHVTAVDANVTSATGVLSVDGSIGHNLTASGAGITFGTTTTVGNALQATSTGAITESGTLSVTGTSNLNANANDITLTNGNLFGGLVTAQGGAVRITDNAALSVALTSSTSANLDATGLLIVSGTTTGNLDATGGGVAFGAGITSVGGTLTVDSGGGAITQAGTSAVHAAAASLDAGTGIITLANPGNDFGTVSVTGGAVSLADTNAMTVHLLSATSGTLVAGGALTVDGATSGALAATGNGIVFGTTHVGDTLSATTTGTGTITQTGQLGVVGASTLNAGAHAIDLSTFATNDFGGAVTATGSTVALTDANALAVHLSGVGGATLVATTQLAIDGGATGAVSATGNGVVFTAAGTTVGGALDVHSGTGTISQAGSLGVTGTTLLDAGTNNVTLQTGGNAFGGLVTVNGGTVGLSAGGAMSVHLGTVNNAALVATNALAVDGNTAAGLTVGGNGVSFGATGVGGALVATTTGAGTIAQTAQLSVSGTSTLNAGTNAVTLGNPLNDFGGAVTVSGGAVTLADATALTAHLTSASSGSLTAVGALAVDGTTTGALTVSGDGVSLGTGATTVGGALVATATGGGTIAQTGTLQVGGPSTLDAGSAGISLAAPGNHFGGLVTATGGAVALADTGSLSTHLASATSATLTAANALTVDGSDSGNLTANGTGVTLGAAGTTVGGTLNATASTGDITQTGVVAVNGTSTLGATAGAVTLANPNNDFTGAVTANAAGAVSLADVNALTAHVTGASATLNAGGLLTVDASTPGALQATGNGVVFGTGATTVGGALTAHSGSGTISQSGTLAVTGATTLDAGTNAITLATATNDFVGAVTLNGGTVNLADANALTAHLNSTAATTLTAAGLLTVDGNATAGLTASGTGVVFGTGATHVTGALVATSGTGSITQSGALTVTGTSTLNAGTNAITLTNAGNDFTGTVSTTGGVVSLTVANALAIHLANSTSETLNAGGVLTVDGSTAGNVVANGNGVVFGATTIGGTLATASGTGTITQTGPLAVTGATTLDAGGNAITLGNGGNDFTGAVTATGGAITLADATALTAHVTGASAALTAGGPLAVDGSTTGALNATGAGITFGATTVHGALTAASTGAVTQTGDLAVTGASTISAAGQTVTLARQTNALSGGVTVTGAAVDLEQAGAITAHLANAGSATVIAGGALTVDGSATGNVTANGTTVTFGSTATSVGGTLAATSSAGDITQAGALAVTGASTLHAGSGNVTLASAGNVLGGAVTAAGAAVTLVDASPLTAHVAANGAAALTSSGALTVDGSSTAMTLNGTAVSFGAAGTTVNGALTANGTSIGQSGALAVTGLSTLNAGSGDILLDSPGTNLQSAITATGHVIHLTDAHAIDATITASSDVVLNSTADVKAKGAFNGGLKISGAKVSVDTGTSGSPLGVGGLLDVTSTGDTSLGYVNAGSAKVAATGSVLLNGTLKSAGSVSITGSQIQGVNKLGALDVASGGTVNLDTSAGGGNIGKGATTPDGAIDDLSIIQLLNVTGQSGMVVTFNPTQSAWFRVGTQAATPRIQINPSKQLGDRTYFCDTLTCVNVSGVSTAIADTVVSNILSAAAQDAADAAFGTENLDFAIRKGYVTTIGRVPPGIDEIAGDLGATQCDSRVTSPTTISANGGCGPAIPNGGPKRNPLDKVDLPKN